MEDNDSSDRIVWQCSLTECRNFGKVVLAKESASLSSEEVAVIDAGCAAQVACSATLTDIQVGVRLQSARYRQERAFQSYIDDGIRRLTE